MIALISNYNTIEEPIDLPSADWLGNWLGNESIRQSGLWNVNHIDENFFNIIKHNY